MHPTGRRLFSSAVLLSCMLVVVGYTGWAKCYRESGGATQKPLLRTRSGTQPVADLTIQQCYMLGDLSSKGYRPRQMPGQYG